MWVGEWCEWVSLIQMYKYPGGEDHGYPSGKLATTVTQPNLSGEKLVEKFTVENVIQITEDEKY